MVNALLLLAALILAPLQDRAAERESMVREQIEERGISDPATLRALRRVPRHLFVPLQFADDAYDDRPLPIGYGQTISQPYIVAAMTAMVRPSRTSRVLEIGSGSGYQAAVLAEIVDTVYTIEIITELAKSAADLLAREGSRSV